MSEKLSIKVTHRDCEWSFSRASGNGGQGVNKSNSKVHCRHKASGAVGQSQETRSQGTNKGLAFMAMAKTPKFRSWAILEAGKRLGREAEIAKAVEDAMDPRNIRVEIKDEDGLWVETDLELPTGHTIGVIQKNS